MKTPFLHARIVSFMAMVCLVLQLQASTNDVAFNLYCPDDVTVDCNAELWDLSIYGNATYHDQYGYHDAGEPVVHYYLNGCGGGYITRKWTVEDYYWNTHTCTQYITVGGAGFNGNSITWPAMYVAEGCNPNVHPDVTGYPSWVDSECSLIGYNYTDKLYTVSPGCKKILRKWTLIDWCMNSTAGYNTPNSWTFTQTIKIVESTPPSFVCPADITVLANECKWGKVTANPLTIDPATCGGNYDISNNSPYSTEKGANLSGTYPVGVTKVTYTVKYACGSKKTCTVNVTVKPKAPTAICINSLAIALMGMDTNNDGINDEGMATIWAKDLNWKSESKCGYNPLRFSFSPDPNDMSKTFTCDNIGKNTVRMYVTDAKGGQSFCEVMIDVQNNGANIQDCHPAPPPPDTNTVTGSKLSLKGKIQNIYNENVKDIDVELFDPQDIYKYVTKQEKGIALVRDSIRSQSGNWIWFYTEKEVTVTKIDTIFVPEKIMKRRSDDNGAFAYDSVMVKAKNYTLKSIDKELDLKNIDKNDIDLLTAYLVDNTVFTEAWQYLAADVDRNGLIDINDLNLLIKYVKGDITTLHSNQWSLVYWTEATTGMKADILGKASSWNHFTNVTADIKDVQFKLIQIGDINKESLTGGNIAEEINAETRSSDLSGFSIYPNPFNDKIILQITADADQAAQLVLSDMQGKLVEIKNYTLTKGQNLLTYDALKLSAGLYIYSVRQGTSVHTGKIIKSN